MTPPSAPFTDPFPSIARPAWKFFVPLVVLAAILALLSGMFNQGWLVALAGVAGVLAVYVLWFFRHPRRTPESTEEGTFISPADGKLVSVIELPDPHFEGGRCRRIAIFLNVFNVHTQRASEDGQIFEVHRREGKFINALNEKCSEENEQLTIWLRRPDGVVWGLRQIAGAIARRIVLYAKEGQALRRGETYGLIQFGSRVELFLPLDAEILVKPGVHVRAGETALARVRRKAVAEGDRQAPSSSAVEVA